MKKTNAMNINSIVNGDNGTLKERFISKFINNNVVKIHNGKLYLNRKELFIEGWTAKNGHTVSTAEVNNIKDGEYAVKDVETSIMRGGVTIRIYLKNDEVIILKSEGYGEYKICLRNWNLNNSMTRWNWNTTRVLAKN